MVKEAEAAGKLPQTDDSWYFAVRQMRAWFELEDDSEVYFRPYILLVIHQESQMVLKMAYMEYRPRPEDLRDELLETMIAPDDSSEIPPHRPKEIHFEDLSLSGSCDNCFTEIGVTCGYRPQRGMIDAFISVIEEEMAIDEEDEIPGLLGQEGVEPRQARLFFEAAASFFLAGPWRYISDLDLMAVRVGKQEKPYFVSVFGEDEIGCVMYVFPTWNEVKTYFTSIDPYANLSARGLHVLNYFSPPMVSFDDMDDAAHYGWKLPERNVYPTPLHVTPEQVARPDADMLHWYEAALLAIPKFVDRQFQTTPGEAFPDVWDTLSVRTSSGKVDVQIEYPGGDLDQVKKWAAKQEELFSALDDVMDLPLLDQEEN